MTWRKIADFGVLMASFAVFFLVVSRVQEYTILRLHWTRLMGTIASVVAFQPFFWLSVYVRRLLTTANDPKSY